MKNLHFLAAFMICTLCISAQTYTGNILITLDKTQLTGTCNLSQDSDNVVYMHSGAGYTNNTAVWQSIAGFWGLADSIGIMTTVNPDTYTMCMNVDYYYTTYADPDSASGGMGDGPLPAGATAYNIGLVFRDQGPFPLDANGNPTNTPGQKGGAGLSCEDIFLLGVNTANITVQDADGNPVAAVTAVPVASCPVGVVGSYPGLPNGVHDISSQLIQDIQVSPNPFTDQVKIIFNMIPDQTTVQAQVYDVMGRMVADFTPSIKGGYNSFTWGGTGTDGAKLPAGAYMLKVTNGTKVMTKKLIKQ